MYAFALEMIGVLSPVESIREMGTVCLPVLIFFVSAIELINYNL